ncbi:hypothetical protein [Brachybacterium sp. GPGPB12]|uniref:hypothetical protein n=1 Tax=Brachybacterium sp. GPGPB12 TaxID=3023517 RepID=UPI0031344228
MSDGDAVNAAPPPEKHGSQEENAPTSQTVPSSKSAPPERPGASEEPATTTGALARLGFSRTDRVSRFLSEPAARGLGDGAAEALGATADGDDAVLGLLCAWRSPPGRPARAPCSRSSSPGWAPSAPRDTG